MIKRIGFLLAFLLCSSAVLRAQMPGTFQPLLLGTGTATSCNDAIVAAGATTGLVYSWDISDSGAYAGSGGTITDQSGNGNNWYFGTNGSASAPTFVGTAGSKSSSTYLSYNGSALNRLAVSNPTAINSMSKSGADWLLMLAIQTSSAFVSSTGLFGNSTGSSSFIGAAAYINSDAKLYQRVTNGDGSSSVLIKTSDGTLATSTTMMLAQRIQDSGSSNSYFWQNGNYLQVGSANTWAGAFSNPSGSNATYTMEIAAMGNASSLIQNGARVYCASLWSGTVPTKATLDIIYNASKARLGLP